MLAFKKVARSGATAYLEGLETALVGGKFIEVSA
jgi:hypothetical protein